MKCSDNDLAVCTAKDIAPDGLFGRIDEVTDKLMAMPQASMPVIHRFSPGLYIREVHMPAGTFVIGHEHKTEHFNVMLQGHLVMVNEDGSTTDFIAPQSYSAQPGRKVAYIVEDVVWQNIFPADTQDIDELEDRLLDKSDKVKLTEEQAAGVAYAEHEVDRYDYGYMLERTGLTEEFVRQRSESEEDQMSMPEPVHPWRLAKSPIEGVGYFLTVGCRAGTILAPARIGNKRTPAGRYVNHSGNPNAAMQMGVDGNLYLVAIEDIPGCMGGGSGTEVTTNYEHTLSLMATNNGEVLCQQQ